MSLYDHFLLLSLIVVSIPPKASRRDFSSRNGFSKISKCTSDELVLQFCRFSSALRIVVDEILGVCNETGVPS